METQEAEEINSNNANYIEMEWNMSEAESLIETFVKENQSKTEIQNYFFGKHETKVCATDMTFFEKVYEEKLVAFLPQKGQQHIAEMFENQRWDEVNAWFDGVYLVKHTVAECLKKTKPQFFDAILQQGVEEVKLVPFYHQMQSYFQSTFLECKLLNEQLQLFQSLIKCSAQTELSTTFIDALACLEYKLNCFSANTQLISEIDVIHDEHQFFADLVDKLVINHFNPIPMKMLIEKLFKHSTKIFRENGDKVFEITGRQIVWSNVNEMFGKEYEKDYISQLRLTAGHLLIMDDNITLHGKNLVLIAPEIVIQDSVTCDLSGNNAVCPLNLKAESGSERNKNGENGKNGDNGRSSGNMVICASEIINSKNLCVTLNGGHGSNGQDGGNGFDGNSGIGKKFKKAFGLKTKLKLKAAAIGNIVFGGLPGILRARYKESNQLNAVKRLKSFSTHKWSSHSMVVYQGTKGTPGGRGGLNGLGGYGGMKGNLTVINASIPDGQIEIEANEGKNGEEGKQGTNGKDGMDGWDVACIKKSFGRLRKYGKYNNERLHIVFTDKEDKDTVYVKSKDMGDGSKCYAKIIAKPLRHSMLKDNEQEEVSKRAERLSVLQTNKINLNSIEKTYHKLCNSASEALKVDQDIQVSRIIDRFEASMYIPKPAIEPLIAWKDTVEDKNKWFDENLANFLKQYDLISSDNIDELRDLLKPVLSKLLNFVDGNMLYKCLELMCIENHSISADFIIALLANFEVDGCGIDYSTFKYLVESVITSIQKMESFTFSSILLSMDQSEWIDAFFIYNVEISLNIQIPDKEKLRDSIKKVTDDNFKFFCSRWLKRFPITMEEFYPVIEAMKDVTAPAIVLDKTFVNLWPNVLKYSKINWNLFVKKEDDKQTRLIKFWCSKLASYYSNDEVDETFKLLTTQEINFDKVNIGRLVHRLCIYDFVAGNFNPREDPTVKYRLHEIFDCYFGLSKFTMSDTYAIAQKVVEQFKFEILNIGTNHYLDEAWKECCKNVKNILRQPDSDSDDAFCDELFKKFQECGHLWDMEDFQHHIHETCQIKWKDFDISLLEFVSKVISSKFDIHLRVNQKIAILTSIRGQYSAGILQQLPTGNGKSLIIVITSIILTWKYRTVNIVTSSSVLAKRDAQQYLHIFQIFGIKVNHICDESPIVRAERYETNHVLYGDLPSFQRDYLLDTFYSMKITNNRPHDVVLVDEVDSLLLDQGANTLYLSHEISEMEQLQPLFVKIWQIININTTTEDMTDESLYTCIYHYCFSSMLMLNLMEILKINEKQFRLLKRALLRAGIIDKNEDFLITNCDEIDSRLKTLNEISLPTIQRLMFIFRHIINQERLSIPNHLHEFVKFHLKDLIASAKAAKFMEEGIQYLVDIISSNAALSYEPRIIIIDQNTGTDMPSTQWSNGLHQFLQLKHGLRFTPLSLKAVYISSVTYFKKYRKLYGFSGTLGSRKERTQLHDKYYVDIRLVPSSLPKLFYEEPSIVTTADSHVTQIFNAIMAKLNDNRSVLVICESIKQMDELSADVINLAKKEVSEEKLSPFVNATFYRRDYEKFEYGEGTKLPPGVIIFSTNLAGRGINITLTNKLRKNGGLHVIVAFLPKNLRVEEQAFGRAARFGDAGSGQLITCVDDNVYENVTDFLQLKLLRNAQDNHKIETDSEYYENNVEVEEDCLVHFTNHFQEYKQKLDEEKIDESEKSLLLRNLLDQWALFMDTYPIETSSPKERRSAAEKSHNALKRMNPLRSLILLFQSLNTFVATGDQSVFQESLKECENERKTIELCKVKNPSNLRRIAAAEAFCKKLSYPENTFHLTQPSHILKFAKILIEKKKYTEAEECLNNLITNFSIYAAEAKYYMMYVSIKKFSNLTQSKDDKYKKLANEIKDARSEFERRMFSCFIDRAIIDFYKEADNHKIFKVDVFSHQQMEFSQIFCLLIESIDGLIGGRLNSKSFMTSFVPEEASFLLYEYFTNFDNFNKLPIKATKVCKDFNVEKLKEYTQKHDICFELISSKIASLMDNPVCEKDLINPTNLPTAEDFWESLAKNNVLINQKRHFFVNTVKFETMNPALVDIIKDLIKVKSTNTIKRIFKHSFVLTENWKEIDIEKMENKLQPECISILKMIGTFCETMSAELELKPLCRLNFNSFYNLTIENLLVYNIPKSDIEIILNSLTNNGILKAIDDNTFELSDNLVSSLEEQNLDIPACFEEVVRKALKKYLAFSLAYQKLQHDSKDSKQLSISLPLAEEYSIFFDLIDVGILERPNVDLTALKPISKPAKPFIKTLEALYHDAIASDASSVNIEVALKTVKQKCRNNLKSPNADEKDAEIKDYKHITSDKDKIYQMFINNTCAQQRFETLDVELCSFWDVLAECNLIETRNSSLMFKNCITCLIRFKEKKWSRKTIAKLGLVSVAAITELAIGAVILITTAGGGIPISKYFISQALGDIIYVLKSCYTGYAENYIQHKLISMVMGAVPSFTWIKHLITASEIASKSSTDIMENIVVNKLKNGILSAAINISMSSLMHSKIEDGIEYVARSTHKIITNMIDEEVANLDFNEFAGMNFENAKHGIEKCITEYSLNKITKIIVTICDFVFIQYRNLFMKFDPKMLETDEEQKDSSLFVKIITIAKFLKSKAGFVALHSKMQQEIRIIFNDLKIKVQEGNGNRSEQKESANTQSSADVQNSKKMIAKIIKIQLEKVIEETVNSRVTQPLKALTMSKLQKTLEKKVTQSFEEFKNSNPHKNIRAINFFDQNRKTKIVEEEKENANFLYEEMLTEFHKTTKNPMVYVEIIMAGIGIDEIAFRCIASVITTKLPINVIIKDLSGVEYPTMGHPNGETVHFDFSEEVLGKNKNPSKIFDAILNQIPELPFKDENEFKQAFVEFLKNDSNYLNYLQTPRHPLMENSPMTTQDVSVLLNDIEASTRLFNVIGGTAPSSNILFEAYAQTNQMH